MSDWPRSNIHGYYLDIKSETCPGEGWFIKGVPTPISGFSRTHITPTWRHTTAQESRDAHTAYWDRTIWCSRNGVPLNFLDQRYEPIILFHDPWDEMEILLRQLPLRDPLDIKFGPKNWTSEQKNHFRALLFREKLDIENEHCKDLVVWKGRAFEESTHIEGEYD